MAGSEVETPKYRAIAQHFRERIRRGDLRPGDEIPSERALAVQFGVARPTATKALELLRREGVVESRQGSGTTVTARRPGRSRAVDGRTARIVAAGMVTPAPEHVTTSLEVPAGSAAIRRQQVVDGPEGPEETSTSWYPSALEAYAERLLARARIQEGALSYVESVTGRRGGPVQDRVSARSATGEDAAALGLADGDPVLVIQRVVRDEADVPLEFAEAVYPPGLWVPLA